MVLLSDSEPPCFSLCKFFSPNNVQVCCFSPQYSSCSWYTYIPPHSCVLPSPSSTYFGIPLQPLLCPNRSAFQKVSLVVGCPALRYFLQPPYPPSAGSRLSTTSPPPAFVLLWRALARGVLILAFPVPRLWACYIVFLLYPTDLLILGLMLLWLMNITFLNCFPRFFH